MIDWKEVRIGDQIELAYGKSLPAHARERGPFGVFGSNGCVGQHSASLVPGPGIVVGRKGSVGEVVYSESDFWPIDTTYYVVNKNRHDWRFLYHLLSSIGLKGLNSHSTIPGLNRENVYSIQVQLPPQCEQQSIALVLDTAENAIANEVTTIEKTMALKRATMRALFTRGLRGEALKETEIGPVPESWGVVDLGTLGKIGNGSTPKKAISEYWTSGTYPWLTSAKVYDREIVQADQHVTNRALSECHLPRLRPGTVLIAITGQGKTLGHCAVLGIEATINQHLAYVEIDQSKADSLFVRSYLETLYVYLRQVGAGGGSTKGALTCGFLRGLPIPVPPVHEQREIVTVLDAINRKIDLHRRKRAVLDDLLKSLLHKLMTDKIRVADLDLSALGQPYTQGVDRCAELP